MDIGAFWHYDCAGRGAGWPVGGENAGAIGVKLSGEEMAGINEKL